eukprot:778117-Pelagomonas_calceolata.AAC.1
MRCRWESYMNRDAKYASMLLAKSLGSSGLRSHGMRRRRMPLPSLLEQGLHAITPRLRQCAHSLMRRDDLLKI